MSVPEGLLLQPRPSDAGKRLDAFIHEHLPEYSRARLQSWIKQGRVQAGGHPQKPSYAVREGEEVSVQPLRLEPLKAKPEALPLTVLYEDDSAIVVDKPSGMVVHAGAGHKDGTLVNALLHRFDSLSSVGGDLRPGIVHRIDKETSGLLVVAKTDAAHRSLAAQFQARTVEKQYAAIVHGTMDHQTETLTMPITRDPARRNRMTARLEVGRSAVTQYRVREFWKLFSLLEVTIGTGRTHQIRVHLSAMGHPILGDRLYGAPGQIPGFPGLHRFYLHSQKLCFVSPASAKRVCVSSPLPPDFESMLRLLRTLPA